MTSHHNTADKPTQDIASSTPEGAAVPAGRSRDPAARQEIQAAIDNLVAGTASPADLEVLTDRDLTYCATGEQCCQTIQALARMTGDAPAKATSVLWAAAVTLATRYQQSPRTQRRAPRVNDRRQFRGPQWEAEAPGSTNAGMTDEGTTEEV